MDNKRGEGGEPGEPPEPTGTTEPREPGEEGGVEIGMYIGLPLPTMGAEDPLLLAPLKMFGMLMRGRDMLLKVGPTISDTGCTSPLGEG